jgi:RNA polymerase sigma-70 factor, ECF subfamily
VASQKRSLFGLNLFPNAVVNYLFSVTYGLAEAGAWTAYLLRVMCSTSLYLDGTARMGLLREARRGDRESLATLILPYGKGLYLGALRLTGNPADAEDVRQEAFLKAVSRLEQFTGSQDETRDDLRAWVSRIAANASIDVIRKRRDGRLFSLEETTGPADETLGSNVAAPEDNPEQRFARREIRKLMSDAIAQLTPELRQVCLLRDVLQYSTQEVSEKLHISAMAVRLRLFRAHRKLREKLSVSLRTQKRPHPTVVQASKLTLHVEARTRATRIPLGTFAECACGD